MPAVKYHRPLDTSLHPIRNELRRVELLADQGTMGFREDRAELDKVRRGGSRAALDEVTRT